MEVAPGPLVRSFTTSTPSHSRMNNSSGSSLAQSQYYRSSDSTQNTSQSSLFPPPLPTSTPPINGHVEASDNVINKPADKEASLFQICVTLRNRLLGVPGFEEQLQEQEVEADADTDPVTLLWRTFRRGYPLMTIYNALQPEVRLEMLSGRMTEARREKDAAFKFLQACVNQLKFPTEECFIITDLYGDDTTGFVKVARVVNRVVDLLVQRGILSSNDGRGDEGARMTGKMTQRQHIVDELVRTERTYVQHLEVLQAFKKHVEQKGVIPGDAIHDIFLNLNALLDFQRRFLIRVEQTNALPEDDQNWGKLFTLYAHAFTVYEPYISNQKKCEMTAMREFDKLKEAGGPPELRQIVESPTHLTAFLLKPFQRLTKYPLLLRELLNKGNLDEDLRADVELGIQATSAVLERTNASIDLEVRMQVVQQLKSQVEDWKGHRLDKFGQLLLYGSFTVLKGDPTKDSDSREYNIYLFEKILLCCKEINLNKQKGKLITKSQSTADKRGKPKLQLKGRIFMQNVTETIFLAKPGSYTCQIFWRADDAIEFFVIRFATEDTMKKWREQIEIQRQVCLELARSHAENEFKYIRDQGVMENPYVNADENAEEDYESTYSQLSGETAVPFQHSEFSASRNGSNTSLRSRSTTGESGPPLQLTTSRGPMPRYAAGNMISPPLSLRTQQLPPAAVSPMERSGNSYFSPNAESPISARTSTSSGMFPFPRQQPLNNGWYNEDQTRYTAPAIGRKDMQSGVQSYTDVRNMRNPSSGSIPHPASLSQTRLRSASSPDVHVPNRRVGNTISNQNGVPDVPPVPSYLAHNPGIVNRSQNNSPSNTNGAPPRGATQSPNSKRTHMQHTQNMYSGQYQYEQEIGHNRYDSATLPQATAMTFSRNEEITPPTQLKVKVKVPSEGSTMTLVVGVNIQYQSLKDRIDAKLQRHTNLSLSAGSVKLKYLYDGELVSIQTDEDVQTAFETWREQDSGHIMAGQLGEIELYVQR